MIRRILAATVLSAVAIIPAAGAASAADHAPKGGAVVQHAIDWD